MEIIISKLLALLSVLAVFLWHNMASAAMTIAQQIDVTDGKALGSALIANFGAAAYGDLLFQILVGIGTFVIMGLTALNSYEKWRKIRRENNKQEEL